MNVGEQSLPQKVSGELQAVFDVVGSCRLSAFDEESGQFQQAVAIFAGLGTDHSSSGIRRDMGQAGLGIG